MKGIHSIFAVLALVLFFYLIGKNSLFKFEERVIYGGGSIFRKK